MIGFRTLLALALIALAGLEVTAILPSEDALIRGRGRYEYVGLVMTKDGELRLFLNLALAVLVLITADDTDLPWPVANFTSSLLIVAGLALLALLDLLSLHFEYMILIAIVTRVIAAIVLVILLISLKWHSLRDIYYAVRSSFRLRDP